MILVALVVGGIVGGAVWFKRRGSSAASETTASAVPNNGLAATPVAAHRYGKYIELSGFRISEDARKRATVIVAVTNHSGADMGTLQFKLTMKSSDGTEVGTAALSAANLGPFATVDASGAFKTEMRAYELPDWQFLRAEFEITSQ